MCIRDRYISQKKSATAENSILWQFVIKSGSNKSLVKFEKATQDISEKLVLNYYEVLWNISYGNFLEKRGRGTTFVKGASWLFPLFSLPQANKGIKK